MLVSRLAPAHILKTLQAFEGLAQIFLGQRWDGRVVGVEYLVEAASIRHTPCRLFGDIEDVCPVPNSVILGELNRARGCIGQNDARPNNGIGEPAGHKKILSRRFVVIDLLERCSLAWCQQVSAVSGPHCSHKNQVVNTAEQRGCRNVVVAGLVDGHTLY